MRPQRRRWVETYRCRGLTEQLHTAMKTGRGMEKNQLAKAKKLVGLVGLISADSSPPNATANPDGQ